MLVVLILILVVDVLLLNATASLAGTGIRPLRCLCAAVLDVGFTALHLLTELPFAAHFAWRVAELLLTGLTAFGFSGSVLIFTLLNLSLGSMTGSKNEMISVLLGAAGMGLACVLLGKKQRYLPVELTVGDCTVQLTALRDTGNTLRDPITGKSVLVVDAVIAQRLTGLQRAALLDPVKSMTAIPGLRLVPYQTVGNRGFLLALQIPNARIGNKRGSTIVAFSPEILGTRYQALTGGSL